MTVSLNDEVRARLDAHLDAVERALIAAGNSRERRRGVVDDLEAQIMDMLAARSEVPTVGDLEVVLGKLDPPGAYEQVASSEPVHAAGTVFVAPPLAAARRRYSRAAIAGFICILLSFGLLLVSTVPAFILAKRAQVRQVYMREAGRDRLSVGPNGANLEASESAPAAQGGSVPVSPAPVASRAHWSALGCVLVLIGPPGLAGTVLGWIAFFQIRSSNGTLRGRGLALFDGLFYPVLMVLLVGLFMA